MLLFGPHLVQTLFLLAATPHCLCLSHPHVLARDGSRGGLDSAHNRHHSTLRFVRMTTDYEIKTLTSCKLCSRTALRLQSAGKLITSVMQATSCGRMLQVKTPPQRATCLLVASGLLPLPTWVPEPPRLGSYSRQVHRSRSNPVGMQAREARNRWMSSKMNSIKTKPRFAQNAFCIV